MHIRTLDLFCGGGGSSWGARAAGAQIVCGVDAWGIATDTFRTNFPEAHVVNLTLDMDSGPDDVGLKSDIDMILASPECTNHTCAKGGRPRDEQSRLTARYIINFARELQPRWIVLENVIHMQNWHGFSHLVVDIESLGYNVLTQKLDSSDFGVPQTRKRLFVLCDRKQMPKAVRLTGKAPASAKSILDPVGTWKCGPLDNGRRAKGTLQRAEKAIHALGRRVPFLLVYYGTDGSGGWQPLDRPLRTLTTLDRFGLVTWKGDTPMLRMLQVPELQRAMGFDPGFTLDKGSRRDKVRLLGNGVCPPVMKAIVGSLTGLNSSCGLEEVARNSLERRDVLQDTSDLSGKGDQKQFECTSRTNTSAFSEFSEQEPFKVRDLAGRRRITAR
ncbi:DNA cytosine methyltransferase [Desulfonatronum parangueonense]